MKMLVCGMGVAMILAGGMAVMGQGVAGATPAAAQGESDQAVDGRGTQVGEGGPPVRGAQTRAAAAEKGALTKTMMFTFENAPVETVLREMSVRFGLRVVMMGVVPGKITIMVPEPVDADTAVSLLSTVLLEQKFAVIERPTGKDGSGMELRVMPWEMAKKEAPVRGGNDE